MAKGPRRATIQKAMADLISRRGPEPFLKRIYHVTEGEPGARQILRQSQEDPSLVEYVRREVVIADLLTFCDQRCFVEEWLLTEKEARGTVALWLMQTEPVPIPKTFVWPGEKELAFTRLPWLAKEGPCPTWDNLLGRMSNAEAFKQWVGSLFDEKSYLQQYVWLYGKGNDGKGSINRFLSKVFGPAYCSKQPKERGDKNWTHELLGKRVVVFPDCNDQVFITSGVFKSLTGGDPIGVEAKFEMSFCTRLNCKFLVLSNEQPMLSSEKADRRRIIYCELPSVDESGDEFELKLWEEGGAFLGKCLQAYGQLAPGTCIPTNTDEVDDLIELNELHFAEVFDFYFKIDLEDKANWLPPIQLQRILNVAFKNHKQAHKQQHDFIQYLVRTMGLKKRQRRGEDGTRFRAYEGLIGKPLAGVPFGGVGTTAANGPVTAGGNVTRLSPVPAPSRKHENEQRYP